MLKDNKIIPTEREISKSILEYLTLRKVFCWRNNTGGFLDKRDHYYKFGKTGSGDILGLTKTGQFFSIEVKRPGKKPTDAQVEFMDRIAFNGGIAFVACSIDDVIQILEEKLNEKITTCNRVHVNTVNSQSG